MRHLISLLIVLSLTSCALLPKHTAKPVPSVIPIQNSLAAQQAALDAAGASNTKAGEKLKTAIELADELAAILEQIPETPTKKSK